MCKTQSNHTKEIAIKMSVSIIYDAELRGSNEAAKTAAERILKNMEDCAKRGGPRYTLEFGYNVLKQMCQAMVAMAQNYAVYCDIFERILAPNVEPRAHAQRWSRYLEMTRHFFCLLNDKNLHKERSCIYEWVSNKAHKLQSEIDFDFILGIYAQHLNAQNTQEDRALAEKTRQRIFESMAQLFDEMLQKNREQNFVYKDVLTRILQYLIPKRNPAKYEQFAAFAHKSIMFNALFKLLAELRVPQVSSAESKLIFVQHMKALLCLQQIDLYSAKNEQLSLQLLRVCRSLKVFQDNEVMSYVLTMLHCFVKFIYEPCTANYYGEMCGKFLRMFDKSAETLKDEFWFMEFVVLMSLLINHIEESTSANFDAFKQQIRCNVAMQVSHLELTLRIMQLATSIKQSNLKSQKCCSSTRKHIILLLALSTMRLYRNTMEVCEDRVTTPSADAELDRKFLSITRNGIHVIDSMVCLDHTSSELNSLQVRYNMILTKVTTAAHMKTCITLAGQLLKIKSRFRNETWLTMLRRLLRASSITNNSKCITLMHAIYIAHLLTLPPQQMDYSALLQPAAIFYNGATAVYDMCLLDALEQNHSKYSIIPDLSASQKHLLFHLETQELLKYQPDNLLMQTSLLKYAQTSLGVVLIARQAKKLDTHSKLQHIYKTLTQRSSAGKVLSRIETLTLAHVCKVLATEQAEQLKNLFNLKLLGEEHLVELMLQEHIQRIDVVVELQLIEMMQQALQAFEIFYNKADSEPITSDELLVDWDAIVDDVSFLARHFQNRGYMDAACQAWLLLYRMAKSLLDTYNELRAFAFLLEHSTNFEQSPYIDLSQEVKRMSPIILEMLPLMPKLFPRRQNYLLLCLCHLALYYARLGNRVDAHALLQFVRLEHSKIVERADKFDFVLATLAVVRFRILWKHSAHSAERKCLIRIIDQLLQNFRSFVCVASEDPFNYITLMFTVMQEIAECTTNRLCDDIIGRFMCTSLKAALEAGAALRVVQLLAVWSLNNLQMEFVDKAQSKLKVIDCFLRLRNVKDVRLAMSACAVEASKTQTENLNGVLNGNQGMETMRRVAPVLLSPVKTDKLRLTGTPNMLNLKRFLQHEKHDFLSKNHIMQWTFVTIGCITARLMFLVEEYQDLPQFYAMLHAWCQKQDNTTFAHNYQNLQLMSMQHFINYLRKHKKHKEALHNIDQALAIYNAATSNIDNVYLINLKLQQCATQCAMHIKVPSVQLRRALQFQKSPEDNQKQNLVLSKKPTNSKLQNEAFVILDTDSESESAKPNSKSDSYVSTTDTDTSMITVIHVDNATQKSSTATSYKVVDDVIEILSDGDASLFVSDAYKKVEKLLPTIKPGVVKTTRSRGIATTTSRRAPVTKQAATSASIACDDVVEIMKTLQLNTSTSAIEDSPEKPKSTTSRIRAARTTAKSVAKSVGKSTATTVPFDENTPATIAELMPRTARPRGRPKKTAAAATAASANKENILIVEPKVRTRKRLN